MKDTSEQENRKAEEIHAAEIHFIRAYMPERPCDIWYAWYMRSMENVFRHRAADRTYYQRTEQEYANAYFDRYVSA